MVEEITMATLRYVHRTGFRFCLSAVMILLLALSDVTWAEVRPEYSGSWYNPSQSGHGFSIEVISPTRSIVYWYTYDPFGYPIFLFGDGRNVGNRIEADVYAFYGMVFGEFDPNTNERLDWGTLSLTFKDCTHATLQYNSTLQYQTGETFGSGQIPLTRLVSVEGYSCSDFPLAGVYRGILRTASGDTFLGHAVVSETGELAFGNPNLLMFGQVIANGNTHGDLTASGTAILFKQGEFADFGNFSLDGAFYPDSLGGYFTSSVTNGAGGLDLTKMWRATHNGVALSDLSGSWTAYSYVSGRNYEMTVSSNGSFSASDGQGCSASGRFSIPNAELGILEGSMTVSSTCTRTNPKFDGQGMYFVMDPNTKDDDWMYWIGWNGTDDFSFMSIERN